MAIEEPYKNRMMQAAPAKKAFHFSGDGIYHNQSIQAATIDDATKEWLATRKLIASEQSTPVEKEESEPTVQ